MNSEMIVVLVLIALAVGFILWVKKHDHGYEEPKEGEQSKNRE